MLLSLVLVALMPVSQAGAYSWKESWIDQLQKEIEFLKWRVESLTFELGDRMPVPAIDLLLCGKDCDDASLYMYLYFTASGYKVDIIQGNLEKTNETKSQAKHIWVLVHSSNRTYAYDYGYYYYDEQHYEGYLITYKQLLSQAITDR